MPSRASYLHGLSVASAGFSADLFRQPRQGYSPIRPKRLYHFGFGRGGTGLHVAGTLSSLFRTGCLGGGGGGGGGGGDGARRLSDLVILFLLNSLQRKLL